MENKDDSLDKEQKDEKSLIEANKPFSLMAEEYNRLIEPLTKKLEIEKRWNDIISPVLRVAELNPIILPAVSIINVPLANHLREITTPFQPLLDHLIKMESNYRASINELINPNIFLPSVSPSINQLEQELSIINKSIVEVNSPWMTRLESIPYLKIPLLDDTNTSSIVKMLFEAEKAVANTVSLPEQCSQIPSITAQLASISQIGLNDEWKNVLVSPGIIEGLSSFAISQYRQIQKGRSGEDIAWRFGLINTASKYVDSQIHWGLSLAAESQEKSPSNKMITPDFSEMPILFGHAKRDNKGVEEAFDESQLRIITETGRIIIQKARVINDYCKLRNKKLLFPESDLFNWAMVLAGSYCRNIETLNEVMTTLHDMFMKKTIIDLIGEPDCFETIKKYRKGAENTKTEISKIQKHTYCEISIIEDRIIELLGSAQMNYLDEDSICNSLYKALLNVQGNRHYKGAIENVINDAIRDQLSIKFDVNDQTRLGESIKGMDSGEIDIMIRWNGLPCAIIEGVKLRSVDSSILDTHINKVLSNYNPIGCPFVFLLIYAEMKDFNGFWDKLTKHMQRYVFPYEVLESYHILHTAFSESRHGKIALKRNGAKICFHVYAVSMM